MFDCNAHACIQSHLEKIKVIVVRNLVIVVTGTIRTGILTREKVKKQVFPINFVDDNAIQTFAIFQKTHILTP